MRDITNTATLADVVTAPVYLVELGFSPSLYSSSGPQVTWNGQVWQENGVSIDSMETDVLGRVSASISMSNLDRVLGTVVLQQNAKDHDVKIYVHYPSGSAGSVDPMLLVEGIMDGASVSERVFINVISRSAYFGSSPRIVCAPPVFNHLPPTGTVLNWGSVTLTLERR